MSKNLSSLLAGAVFATGFLTAPIALHAEDRNGPEMPDQNAFDPNPSAPDSKTGKILTYGVDKDGNTVPMKVLRITNNSGKMVYPVIRDENSTIISDKDLTSKYDPYDDSKREYRGYIGYKGTDDKYHFGLKNGDSIVVSIPLVFWNAARIGIGTDGKYLVRTQLPNPLNWDPSSRQSITPAMPGPIPTGPGLITNSGTSISNGVVMWYRSEISRAPQDDTEDQLAEWTIRDHAYLVSPQMTAKTKGTIPDNELIDLINYDVSNVDNLFLPVSMQAGRVWVQSQAAGLPPDANRKGWVAGEDPQVNAWTGAIGDIGSMQDKIKEFIATPNELLGNYFPDKKGWPYYNMPESSEPGGLFKIPSGANVFAQSPLKGTRSSYGNGSELEDRYMLSSGGTESTFVNIGWAGGTPDEPPSDVIHLSNETSKLGFLRPGLIVIGRPPEAGDPPVPTQPNPIKPGTSIKALADGNRTVTLSQELAATTKACGFVFKRVTDDYASIAMIKLWFSWAEYYRTHWKDDKTGVLGSYAISGTLKRGSATMTFDEPHKELIPGMAVKGAGISDAVTEKDYPHTGEAVILEVASDGMSVILSQMPSANTPVEGLKSSYTFLEPQKLYWLDEAEKLGALYKFDFSRDKGVQPGEFHDPYKFSQTVYLIMASMDQIGRKNNDSICKFMQNIVGANMGYIFDQPAKETPDGQMVIASIRDLIKSALRGVTDFTEFPDEMAGKEHKYWYPNPSTETGNQKFNVFNLDPFVWFVHVKLGFSGYGFSIDDDTADIGAGGATQLQISVTGTGGLVNLQEWSNQAPFGPLTEEVEYSGPVSGTTGATQFRAVDGASNTTPIRITTEGTPFLSAGDTVVINNVQGNTAANGTFKIGNVTRTTFDLFDAETGKTPIAGNGNFTGIGRWSFPLHPYLDTGSNLNRIYYKVNGDDTLGTFLGTFVSGPDISTEGQPRIWARTIETQAKLGLLILTEPLKDTNGKLLPAGKYKLNFFGLHDPEKKH